MRRALPAAVAVAVALAAAAAERTDELTDLLRQATGRDRPGALARARLINEADARTGGLVAGLRHDDDVVRLAAAWALGHAPAARKAMVVPALAAALSDENFSVARAAAVSLKAFDAVEGPLRDLLASPDSSLRWRAVINVDYLPLPGLCEDVAAVAVGDPVDFVRADAAWTLRHGSGAKVAEALVRCLADPYARVRQKARHSLLRGRVAAEVRRKGSPVRRRTLEALLKLLETHGDKPHAARAAVDVLNELVVRPIGADPAGWRRLVRSQEGRP